MPASAAALRAAIHGTLKSDGPLAAMLGGAKIYDEPPREAALPWPGAMAVWRSANGESFERIGLSTIPVVIGKTLDPLPAGPLFRWDRASSIRVKIASGALSSQSDLWVLGGANACAIQNENGAWEVVQFARAELVSENTYLLSRLLRGQQGSEQAMASLLEAGSPFVLLDDALVALARGADMLGRDFQYRVGPASHDVGSLSMRAISGATSALSLMPRSPAHLRAQRTEDGVLLTWIRRTRIGGDSWDTAEVPLGEDFERYRVEILDGEEIVRVIEADASQALYMSAHETEDFGAPQTSLAVRVAQLSALAGPGHAREAILSVQE